MKNIVFFIRALCKVEVILFISILFSLPVSAMKRAVDPELLNTDRSAISHNQGGKVQWENFWEERYYTGNAGFHCTFGYRNLQNGPIESISIAAHAYLYLGEFKFDRDLSKSNHYIEVTMKHLPEAYRKKFSEVGAQIEFTHWSQANEISYKGKDLKIIKRFLDIVQEIEPSFTYLRSRVVFKLDTQVDPQQMLALSINNNKEGALQFANDFKEFRVDLVWLLAEYYFSNEIYEAALDIYQEIEESNPYFIESTKRCETIVSTVLDLNQQGKYPLTKDEKHRFLQMRLKLALNTKNNRLAGRLFEELSGITLPENALDNFSGDYETLIAICGAVKKN